jgi:hypothetical protein
VLVCSRARVQTCSSFSFACSRVRVLQYVTGSALAYHFPHYPLTTNRWPPTRTAGRVCLEVKDTTNNR